MLLAAFATPSRRPHETLTMVNGRALSQQPRTLTILDEELHRYSANPSPATRWRTRLASPLAVARGFCPEDGPARDQIVCGTLALARKRFRIIFKDHLYVLYIYGFIVLDY